MRSHTSARLTRHSRTPSRFFASIKQATTATRLPMAVRMGMTGRSSGFLRKRKMPSVENARMQTVRMVMADIFSSPR